MAASTKPLTALPYLGGKNPLRKVGPWVAAHLPMRKGYCEPMAGMASVLLNRPHSRIEILNDLDGHIVAFWRAVRDNGVELQRQLDLTPVSREEFKRAQQTLKDGTWESEITRARDVTIQLWQGYQKITISRGWASPCSGGGPRPNITALVKRLRDVALEQRDAVELLDYLSDYRDFTIFCDPPYQSDTSREYQVAIDRDALVEVLLKNRQHSIALSGYGAEWDMLLDHGWKKDTMKIKTELCDGVSMERQESLWVNYPSPAVRSGDLFDRESS